MKTIFERDLSGEMVSPNDPGYDELINDIFATMKKATEMNTGYRTPEEVHEFMGEILDKPLPKSTTVLPPFYICLHSIGRHSGLTAPVRTSAVLMPCLRNHSEDFYHINRGEHLQRCSPPTLLVQVEHHALASQFRMFTQVLQSYNP